MLCTSGKLFICRQILDCSWGNVSLVRPILWPPRIFIVIHPPSGAQKNWWRRSASFVDFIFIAEFLELLMVTLS